MIRKIFLYICFFMVNLTYAQTTFKQAEMRAAYLSNAINVSGENEAPLNLMRDKLSASDRKQLDKIIKNKTKRLDYTVMAVGDQVQFYKGETFLYSIAFKAGVDNVLLLNGWIEYKFDPKNIWRSLNNSKQNVGAAIMNLIVSKAEAASGDGEKKLTPLFLSAGSGRLSEIPNIYLPNKEIRLSTAPSNSIYIFNEYATEAMKDLEVQCLSQNRASVKYLTSGLAKGNFIKLNDNGDNVEFDTGEDKMKISFLKEPLSEAERVQELEICPQSSFVRLNRMSVPRINSEVLKTKETLNMMDTFVESRKNYQTLSMHLGLGWDAGESTNSNIEKYNTARTIVLSNLIACNSMIKNQVALRAKIPGAKNDAEKDIYLLLAKLSNPNRDYWNQSSLDFAKRSLERHKNNFKEKNGLAETLEMTGESLVKAPPTNISGANLQAYKERYIRLEQNIENIKSKMSRKDIERPTVEIGLSLLRSFGKCCGDNNCKAEMAKAGVNMTPSKDYSNDQKESAVK